MTCLYISEDEDIVDLRAMSTVGGVMYLDLLKLPPQAKKVGNWVIQDSKYLLSISLVLCNFRYVFLAFIARACSLKN